MKNPRWAWSRRIGSACLVAAACTLTAADAVAAGGGKPATQLVCVSDTRDLTGIARWIGDLYNTNLVLFAIVVVVTMSGMGLLLGTLFDRLVSQLGIDLGKLNQHE